MNISLVRWILSFSTRQIGIWKNRIRIYDRGISMWLYIAFGEGLCNWQAIDGAPRRLHGNNLKFHLRRTKKSCKQIVYLRSQRLNETENTGGIRLRAFHAEQSGLFFKEGAGNRSGEQRCGIKVGTCAWCQSERRVETSRFLKLFCKRPMEMEILDDCLVI